ncbi:MAG: hypothetical protein DCC73_11845 [Proteobacteria bacterium]|nr:MAG: hypothetical protein DCC73_11845 [Pseudomonadota bacterium]
MSWTPLSHNRAGAHQRTCVRVALRLRGKKRLGVIIAMPDLILAHLGWKRGDKVAVQIGGGEHAGLVKLAKSDVGYVIGTSGTGKHEVKQVVLPAAWAGLPKTPRPACEAAHHFDDDCLIITLPTWAPRAPALAPAQTAVVTEKTPVAARPTPPLDPKWAAAMKGKTFGGKVQR